MIQIANASAHNVTEWEQDGLKFIEITRQEYAINQCVFSSGEVIGHPIDTLYIRWQKDGDEGQMLLLRPDEMAAIGWVSAGVLFSLHLSDVIKE